MTEQPLSPSRPSPTPTPPPAEPRRWAALAVIALAQLLTALDATIVSIALPTAQHDLGFTDADRQWVITAYTLSFASLLLVGGRVADRIGRRRALLVGLGGFAAASALAGAAPTFAVLLAGRALQGAFAALLAPTALSLVVVLFTDQRERRRAFAIYGAVASSGAIVGLVVGGTLTQYVDWRWCLYVNVVFALTALLAGARVLPRLPAFRQTPIPVASAVVATGGLVALVYGASRAADAGWGDRRVVAALACGALSIAGFLALQRRMRAPMLPLHLLAHRRRLASYTAVAAAVVASFGLSLMLTYHFQGVLGWEPVQTGLAFLPLSAAVAASGYAVSGKLDDLLPPRWLVAGGLGLAACGLAVLSTLTPTSGYLTTVLPALLLVGAGMGGVFTPAIGVVTSGVEQRDAGIAAAVANTSMQVGSSLGVAVLNTIAITATRALLDRGQVSQPVALVHGYATAAGSAAAGLAAVAIGVAVALRPPAPTPPPTPPADARASAGSANPSEGASR